MEVLNNIINDILVEAITMVVICLLVLVAMTVDFFSGLYKAKLRGENSRSKAMRESVRKFISYEGALVIAGVIDFLIVFCRLLTIMGLESIKNIPFVSIFIGIVLCMIELKSVREKATAKEQKRVDEAIKTLGTLLDKTALEKLLKK